MAHLEGSPKPSSYFEPQVSDQPVGWDWSAVTSPPRAVSAWSASGSSASASASPSPPPSHSSTPPASSPARSPARSPSHSSTRSASSPAELPVPDPDEGLLFRLEHTLGADSAPARLARSTTTFDLAGRLVAPRKESPRLSQLPCNSTSEARIPRSSAVRLNPLAAPSRPIAIDLPAPHRPNRGGTSTPLAPLTGRPDSSTAYSHFPFPQDIVSPAPRPQSRPFRLDGRTSRSGALNQTAESTRDAKGKGTAVAVAAAPAATMTSSYRPPVSAASTLPTSKKARARKPQVEVPVSSYNPLGTVSNGLPLGKYYPSNYERRTASRPASSASVAASLPKSRRQQLVAAAAATPSRMSPALAQSAASDSTVPRHRPSAPAHACTDPDVQRRLQQYRRDMMMQATMSALAVAGGPSRSGGGGGRGGDGDRRDSDRGSIDASIRTPGQTGMGMVSLRTPVGARILEGHRPISPRLEPLGWRPDEPMTPMVL